VSGNSNFARVLVAGDGAFVHGAKAAEYKGKMAALSIARDLHRLSSEEYQQQSEVVNQELRHDLYPRPFIDALYRPGKELFGLADSTIVCRCEGVTAGRIRELVKAGHTDHNEIKAIIRCGMGPCQGRMCSSAVHELIVEGSGIAPEKARQHRLRPPIKPVNLLELANANLEDADEI
jgi:bacterioferritin-associated ferredoxin